MIKPIRYFVTLLLFVVFAINITAQEKDFQIWNELTIEKKISKEVSLYLEQGLRLQDNAQQFEEYLVVLGANYSFNKHVKVQGAYRYTSALNVEDLYNIDHRIYADLMLKEKIDRFSFGYRCRYMLTFEDFNQNRWHFLRNRFTIKYNLPKTPLTPYAELEFYYTLNHPEDNHVNRVRYTAGLEYKINKVTSVYSFYRLITEREIFKVPKNNYILGLGLQFDF